MNDDDTVNKKSQSELQRSRNSAKSLLVTMGERHTHPQNYPLPWADPQTQLSASSLDPSDLPTQTTSISEQPFCYNALDRQTDTYTHTDRDSWRECKEHQSLIIHNIACCKAFGVCSMNAQPQIKQCAISKKKTKCS